MGSEVINRVDLAERLDNDFSLFVELTGLFFEDVEKLLKNIRGAIDTGDSEKVRKSAHTVKGSLANFSAERAYQAAYALETIGKNGELDKAENAYASLTGEVKQVVEAMKQIIAEGSFSRQ